MVGSRQRKLRITFVFTGADADLVDYEDYH